MTFSNTEIPVSTDFNSARDAAKTIAKVLAKQAVNSDQSGSAPFAELDLLRKAGLLRFLISKPQGGLGGNWPEALQLVRIIAGGNGSVGQLLGYHYLNSTAPRLVGTAAQAEKFETGLAEHNWFVGDSVNPLDPLLEVTRTDNGYVLNGTKTFSTGALVSDRVLLAFGYAGKLVFAIIPGDREGLKANDDFDFIGVRQSASGTVNFTQLSVLDDEVLGEGPVDPAAQTPLANLLTPLIQSVFAHLYLGIAEGALAEAADYTRQQSRPWFKSGVDAATSDPHIQARYGELVAALDAAVLLANHAGEQLLVALEKGAALTPEERASAAVLVFKAKLQATKVGLDTTATIFELAGARASTRKLGLDRYWRDVRVHTLHDPVFYKAREVGAYFLTGEQPLPTFYS